MRSRAAFPGVGVPEDGLCHGACPDLDHAMLSVAGLVWVIIRRMRWVVMGLITALSRCTRAQEKVVA
jgi:hypothetical protein